MSQLRVLAVCMGNICRSPMAHGVFEAEIDRRGWRDRVQVDSAGTHAYHVGEAPDPRAQLEASQRGYYLADQRARQLQADDFDHFDYILVMDEQNHADAARIRPPNTKATLQYLLDFSNTSEREVPDPYYGGPQGFALVMDLVENAVRGFLDQTGKQRGWDSNIRID
ncbi:MAG: low molecular weight protein-tyrosine-phosphatase [Thioalkalivibrionaceae bacterium]